MGVVNVCSTKTKKHVLNKPHQLPPPNKPSNKKPPTQKHLLAMVDHFGESSAGTLALFDRYGRPGVGVRELRAFARMAAAAADGWRRAEEAEGNA
jgi:hypothetical protein